MGKDRNPSIRAAVADLIRDDPEVIIVGIFVVGVAITAILGVIFGA